MPERLVLCGGAEGKGRLPSDTIGLKLYGPGANIDLRLQDISRRMVANVPDLLTDLLEIATYVLCADEAVSRGGETRRRLGADWRRRYRLVVPVRVPDHWASTGVTDALTDLLTFLSEDEFSFEFVRGTRSPPFQSYLDLSKDESAVFAADEVVLFSGGMDSLAGAVEELRSHHCRVALVSHQSSTKISDRQRHIASELSNRFPGMALHVPVRITKNRELPTLEYTQRTRSFLFAALAAAVASMMGRQRIRFYENGVVSYNLPIAGQVIGAQATRTTHPRVIRNLARFVSVLLGEDFSVENPFSWKTKSEVARLIAASGHADLVRHSVSCSRVRSMTTLHPHCGTCFQCLDRRFAALDACLGDDDPAEMYRTDLLLDERNAGFDRTMAEAYVRRALEFRRFTQVGFLSQCIGEISRSMSSFPGMNPDEVATRAFDLHRRHGDAVHSVLANAVREHAAELVSGTLSPNCLLRIAIGEHRRQFDDAAIEPSGTSESVGNTAKDQRDQTSEIMLAVDETSQRVLIRGLPSVMGKANCALMAVLQASFKADRDAGRMPDNFRYTAARTLAARLSIDEQTLRRRVSRLRKLVAQSCVEHLGLPLSNDAIIQSKAWQGYRLNPAVRLVAAEEVRS